jgi:ATP phosphoribosyltransferase regulatory subunit
MSNKEQYILPLGFCDLIFTEAEIKHRQINLAINNFLQQDYRLIKPPLLELADNYNQNDNKTLHNKNSNPFFLVDPLSGNNLVIRSDITKQIKRIINSTLNNHQLPIKLCYVGDVLCSSNSNLHLERQQTQIGIEIIHSKTEDDDFLIITQLVNNLYQILEIEQNYNKLSKKIIPKMVISISLPKFLENLLLALDINISKEVIDAVNCKNISAITRLIDNIEKRKLLIKIMLNDLSINNIINDVINFTNSNDIIQALERARKINDFITKKFNQLSIVFDLFGDSFCDYHHQIFFEIFLADSKYPLARGGRYQISSGNKQQESIDAVGATIYLNNINKG